MQAPKDSLVRMSREEVARKATPNFLLVIIGPFVYDLTTWCPIHPGGSLPLLHLAGRDATDVFRAMHGAVRPQFLSLQVAAGIPRQGGKSAFPMFPAPTTASKLSILMNYVV